MHISWIIMWSLSVAIFAICKWVTWFPIANQISGKMSLGYLFAWPGLSAAPFSGNPDSKPIPTKLHVWVLSMGKILLGIAMVWIGMRYAMKVSFLLAGWVGMVGLILILHFGIFHLLALVWNTRGRDVKPLMQEPWRSQSLGEFWGRRWNVAFRDVSQQILMRPIQKKVSPIAASFWVFLISGLIHDIVISIPARGGYGLPTGYFLIQWVGMLFQKSQFAKRRNFNRGWRGRCLTGAFLIMPIGMLFHPPFVQHVMLPFFNAVGAVHG